MKLFTRPEFNLLEEKNGRSFAKFEVEPLERGFGITLGNALRRTLLEATPGAAVYAIKLRGAAHEFTSIEGIVENVSRIILNIKNIVLEIDENMFPEEETVELKLVNNTPGEIKAGDIDVPTGVKVLNEDLHIATLAEGGIFDLTLFAKYSRGYKSFKDNKKEKNLIADAITIDSNYSPVVNVSYEVEPTRIGRAIDLEKLTLSVTTNGSLTATNAVALAARVLTAHLEAFINLNETLALMPIIGENESEDDKELDRAIEDFDFTQRSLNCLKRAGINLLRDLVSRSEDEIQEIRNLGRKSFKEIKDKVAQLNLTFRIMN
ncbi:DNA-directed RNA polymerase subunit alpha [Spiroplasma endosymbiont of Labia minor]|uniref:DNA-directed RNA polymerase subunit alpha n=1 Tax=Spiroplasma endosymbiont of Labia minor TaxID=3066305 RepID=UPI0030D1FDB6